MLTFVDLHASRALVPFYDQLVGLVGEGEPVAEWTRDRRTLRSTNIILAQHPLKLSRTFGHTCVLGQRLLNRRERMTLIDRLDIPAARWAAPRKQDVYALFDQWGPRILYKADMSLKRRGVKLVHENNVHCILDQYNPGSDVFSEFLQDDLKTYKVDLFLDKTIGCRVLHSPHPLDAGFLKVTHPMELVQLPDSVITDCKRIAYELLRYGAGYISIDFMRKGSEYVVIEVNTTDVGRLFTWPKWPDIYVRNYACGVVNWLLSGEHRPTLYESRENAVRLRSSIAV